MYVYEEMINGKKLTEIINETHENVKYLPGHKLPENVVSNHFYLIYFWFFGQTQSREWKKRIYVCMYVYTDHTQ